MLNDDYELSREDIQDLSSRDALAAFFAKLGYDTNERLVQNVAAMGFGSDNLKSAITHIERLASQNGRMFEVYLFELKSVTIASTQGIVRAFRNRPGDYLLVLTDDYQRLDFVLVERYSSDSPRQQETFGLPQTSRQVGVRPRILTVHRRNPDAMALRVLRRFTYTESDTIAQYEKLLSAYDVADWSEPFFNNRALFSDYYLTTRLPESPDWKNASEAGAMTRAFRELRELYADVRETFSNQPEAVVRARLLEPVLATLGFAAQPVKASHSETPEPDYRLYPASAARDTSDKPLALCLAYTWGRNLDGKDDQRDNQTPDENPGAVVVTLLDSGETDWAIVTNGKTWRLYSAKAHSRATNYYEIDLEETLAQSPAHVEHAFRYFWLFFRPAAFVPANRLIDGEQRLMCFLDGLMSESERYARELGERLKERVFFEIFPHFARGFITYARHAGQLPDNLDSLDAGERNHLLEPFFSATLTFLYRLLFLLYAESRDLLPVREVRGYHEKSLEKLKRQVAEKAGTIQDQAPATLKLAYSESSTVFYDRLQELFAAVDKGDAALNVPVYNGGLFMTQPDPADTSPEADVARFLVHYKIPDRELALGLDLMARDMDEKRHDLAFIDYKSLGVRQLGSIYEGLLEFKLRIAPVEMAVVKGKKTEEVIPYSEALQKKVSIVREGRGKDAHDKTLPRSTAYLENDRRERKASGSYYTPDYIVKYIVEHTVGPVLQEKLDALRPVFREAEKTLRAEQDKARALKRDDVHPQHETYKKFHKTLNEAFFDLKVLDPAMGSGHFLVEAVDYITDRLAKILTAFKWNPIVYELAQTRREIQEEMERQGVSIDMSKLTDLNLLKRRVLKSCIYGVDLNPMAVELAKVSLWLDCFTLGAPLSFLDHHMKCGNSLIGGNVQEVQGSLGSGLWGNQFTYLLDATQLMRKVGELSDVTAQEVIASRKAYQGAYDALAPFKRLLDVYISEYFGNKGAKHTTRLYAGAIVGNDYSRTNPEDRKAIETALSLAHAKRFFHWELEFPEVFFDETERKENGGFDAVVGNPPYDVLEKEEYEFRTNDLEQLVHYLEQVPSFSAAFGGKINIFRFFIALYHVVTNKVGLHGYIVPIGLITDRGCFGLRQLLLQKEKMLKINLFPERYSPGRRVFQDAKVSPCIVIAQNSGTTDSFNLVIHDGKYLENVSSSQQVKADEIKTIDPETLAFPQVPESVWRIAIKTHRPNISAYLKDVAMVGGGEIHLTYYKDCFTSDKTKRPMYRGAEIGRYLINEELSQGEKLYLDVEKCRSRKLAVKEFQQRIALQRITGVEDKRRLLGVLVEPGISLAHTVQFIISSSAISTAYLAAIFNSTLLDLRFRVTSGTSNVGVYELEYLPIRRVNFTVSRQERAYYLEKARNLYEHCLDKNDQACVLGFVDHHLSKEPEESDVVHDLLAFLAEEMIRLNKEKRVAQRELLDWLVATLKIIPDKEGRSGIDVLTGKAKLADYPGDYQKGEPPLATDELLEILRKNKNRLGVSLSDAGLVDRIRKMYEESLQRVLPMKERLQKTDALIDAVVYRLYGLTEEEIAVVEGKE